MRLLTRLLVVVAALVDLAACGGGGSHGSTNDPGGGAGGGGGGGGMTQTFAVGGAVANLAGTGLILQNNLGDDLAVPTSGPFTFSMPVASGAAYSVTVKAQPTNPNQICSVSNGSGVSTAIVTSVAVTCATSPSGAFSVGGTVMGLVGAVTLTNTLGGGQSEDLTLASNGGFTFPTAIASGASYSVTVKTPPPGQNCVVSGAAQGTVQNANIADVAVTCVTRPVNSFTIGGTVSGLDGTIVLQNNGGDDLSITVAGTATPGVPAPTGFTFSHAVAQGATYSVTIATQPPGQVCEVAANGAGTVGNANVTNIAVNCTSHLKVSSPDVTVMAGQEVSVCYYFHFDNSTETVVRSIHSTLPAIAPDVMLLVTKTEWEPAGTVSTVACGIQSLGPTNSMPLYVTRRASDGLEHQLNFPADDGSGKPVGYVLNRNQAAIMVLHFLNTGSAAQSVHVAMDLSLYPQGLSTTRAATFVALQLQIHLPPAASTQNPPTGTFGGSCSLAGGTGQPDGPLKFFNMTVSTWSRGVHTLTKDAGAIVLEDTGWSAPATRLFDSPPYFTFASGRVDYECSFANTLGATVNAGDNAATTEKCEWIGYFFPAWTPVAPAPPGALCENSNRDY